MDIIKPTVGRVVLFWDLDRADVDNEHAQAEAAIVAYVYSDRMVNLSVFDHVGKQRGVTSVPLIQPGDVRPSAGGFCEWMPYQIGQAAKYEDEKAKNESGN